MCRHLKGRAIEVSGTIQDYDGRAELSCVAATTGQGRCTGATAAKTYDVERRANTSRKFKYPKAARDAQEAGTSGWD